MELDACLLDTAPSITMPAFVRALTKGDEAELADLSTEEIATLLRILPESTDAVGLMLATPSTRLFERLLLAMPELRRDAESHHELFVTALAREVPLSRVRRLLAFLDNTRGEPWPKRALRSAIQFQRSDVAAQLLAWCEVGNIAVEDIAGDLAQLGVHPAGMAAHKTQAERCAMADHLLHVAASGDADELRLCFRRFGEAYRDLEGTDIPAMALMQAAIDSGDLESQEVVYLNTNLTCEDCESFALKKSHYQAQESRVDDVLADMDCDLYAPVTTQAAVDALLARVKEMDKDINVRVGNMVKDAFEQRGFERSLGRPVHPELLEPLKESFPLFARLIDQIQARASLLYRVEQVTGKPQAMRLPNVLIVGKPGWGKTYFINTLGKILGLPFQSLQMSSMSAGFVLSGMDLNWGNARPGLVHDTLVRGNALNPLFLLDEIDKADSKSQHPVDGSLYQLLEPEQARVFRDECLNYPIDASQINWFASANDIERAHPAIVSRFDVFELPEVTPEIARKTALSVYRESLQRTPWGILFDAEPQEEVIELLAQHAPRESHQILQHALGRASLAARSTVRREDFETADRGKQRVRIGFV